MPSTPDASAKGLSLLQRLSDKVDKGIASVFRRWSVCVCKRPYAVICVSTLFALIWGAAFVLQFEQELDNDDLFTPNNAESKRDRDDVERLYGFYTSRGRLLAVKNASSIDSDCRSRLLFSDVTVARQTIQDFFKLYEFVRDMVAIYEGEPYSLKDICIAADGEPPCQLISILDLWEYNATIINDPEFDPLEKIDGDAVLMNRFGLEIDERYYLGRREGDACVPEGNRSSNVEALAMTINYIFEREEIDGAESDPESQEWIVALYDRIGAYARQTSLDAYVSDQNVAAEISADQIEEDIRLLTLGYALIAIYMNVVLYKNSCLACKMQLSIVSLVAIGFALLSAYGLVLTTGVKVNAIVQILPFLILGLGVDDTFVIVGAYQHLSHDLPVQERIAQTLERAGSSIFITSATDFCAFLMAIYTRLPGVRAFAAYATMSIFFDFVFQVTFFVAFLVLEARRESRYKLGCPNYGLHCCRGEEFDEGNVFTSSPKEQEMTATRCTTDEDPKPKLKSSDRSYVWKKMCGTGDFDPAKPSFSQKLMGSYVPTATLHPIGRAAVIVAELGLLVFSIYGCTKVTMDFDFIEWVIPKDSALAKGFDLESDFFYGDQLFFSVYTRQPSRGDYFDHQDELDALKVALNADPYVGGPVETWYAQFSRWLVQDSSYADQLVSGRAPNATAFIRWLREYLSGPGQLFEGYVLFEEDKIISSKIDALTVDIVDGHQSVDILDSLRNSVRTSAPSLNPFPYTVHFLFFDGYRVIAWETIRNVMLAAGGVFVMNVIMLASLRMASIVVSMVALTDVVVIGYMWYANQYFNPVTAVNMVLIVGIAVDYSAHIAHAFMVLTGDRLERAKGALEHIGAEVLSGAFTTWLGIAVMGFAEHYFFESFFRMFFAIIVAGAWHGLILLPVVLSFIGSDPYPSRSILT